MLLEELWIDICFIWVAARVFWVGGKARVIAARVVAAIAAVELIWSSGFLLFFNEVAYLNLCCTCSSVAYRMLFMDQL